MNNADRAFLEIIRRQVRLESRRLQDLRQFVSAKRASGLLETPIESMPEVVALFGEDNVRRASKTRARHGRRCLNCQSIYFLLPGERSREISCPECGGTLQKGRIDGIRMGGFQTERRTRVLEALGLVAGIPNLGDVDLASDHDYADFQSEPESTQETAHEIKHENGQNFGDGSVQGLQHSAEPQHDSLGANCWDNPDNDLLFQSHINMSKAEAARHKSETALESEKASSTASPKESQKPQANQRLAGHFNAPHTTAFKKHDLNYQEPTSIDEKIREASASTPMGILMGWVLGTLAAALGCFITVKVLTLMSYAISPNLETLQNSVHAKKVIKPVSFYGYVFMTFMLTVLPTTTTYFGSRFGLAAINQWPVRDFGLRFALSLTTAMFTAFACHEVLETLKNQGWVVLSSPIYWIAFIAAVNYRVLIGFLNRRWNNINDRL